MKEFATKEELFRHLKENKDILLMEKKSVMKCADAVMCSYGGEGYMVTKSETSDDDSIHAKVVINTTGLFDSHRDVHIPGLWNKTLKEQRKTKHLQEHTMKFDHVISDKVTPSVKNMAWSDLGFSYEGKTQALVFDSQIEPTRNPFMYKQYLNGYVDQHSVGMQYVSLLLCINDKDAYYKEEKDNWDKYIEYVANRKDVDEAGYFWAVTEAKLIEGSAVVFGSNYATPTLSIKSPQEPPEGTQKDSRTGTIDKEEFKSFIHTNLF